MSKPIDKVTTLSDNEMIQLASYFSTFIRKSSHHLPFRTLCFEQALTCQQILRKRKISSTIFFGVTKSTKRESQLKAHAWVSVKDKIILGEKEANKFKIIHFFSNEENNTVIA